MEEHVSTIPITEAPSELFLPQVPAVDGEEETFILIKDASEGNITFFHVLQPSLDFFLSLANTHSNSRN